MGSQTLKDKQERLKEIIYILKKEYPSSKCSLVYDSPFQLLVATILSAQCTDERVNKVTKKLFKKYPTVYDYLELKVKDLGKLIYSTGFYNNKSKSIKGLCKMLVKEYDGNVPSDINLLTKLPGVGRKTANVVLGNYYSIPSLVVDTHVTRISNLLKMSKSRNAVVIERDLQKIVNKLDWVIFTHLIIDHGRKVCIANRPKCDLCISKDYCPSAK